MRNTSHTYSFNMLIFSQHYILHTNKLTHTHTHSLTLSHTHIQMPTLSHTYTLTLSLSLIHTTYTHNTNTYTLTHSLTHTCSYRLQVYSYMYTTIYCYTVYIRIIAFGRISRDKQHLAQIVISHTLHHSLNTCIYMYIVHTYICISSTCIYTHMYILYMHIHTYVYTLHAYTHTYTSCICVRHAYFVSLPIKFVYMCMCIYVYT